MFTKTVNIHVSVNLPSVLPGFGFSNKRPLVVTSFLISSDLRKADCVVGLGGQSQVFRDLQ